MSDGMTEAFRRKVVRKKINKNVSIDIDLTSKAVRITNSLDGKNAVEVKIKTLGKIATAVEQALLDNE